MCVYPWTHISHKELIYLLQKSTCPPSKVLLCMLLGEGLVGVNHRAIPTSTHKEGNQKSTPCYKFVTQLLPCVHATGLANFKTSIFQFHNHPTSMTLTLPPLYLKRIIKYQISHSIQHTHKRILLLILYTSILGLFKKFTMIFKTIKII